MNLQRIACFGAAVLVGIVCTSGCSKGEASTKDAKKDVKDDALPVEVITLARGGIEATLRNSTHLEAEDEVKLTVQTVKRSNGGSNNGILPFST